ncbi:hypothetical protein Ae201684P_004560 [Aphanomyces euteiches]|nr:hypothetical protein Ae201684P_004560 [Aphanomyces euteiches]
MRPSRVVLTSDDMLPCVCQFQHGLWEDMLAFLPLAPLYGPWRRKNPFECVDAVDIVVRPWHSCYGLTRLDRLFSTLPWTPKLMFVHAIYLGDKNMLTLSHLAPFWPTTRMEDFIAAAIASNDLQGAIECLACLPLTATDVFLGVGHAVMRETWTWPSFLSLNWSTTGATRRC